jgi:hypothetical protein
MCNLQPNSKIGFTILLSVLIAGCGIKWATNKVLSNPDAIAKVGAVYDALTPRDTTEKLFFIAGDSIVVEKTDTITINGDEMSEIANKTDTIRIRTIRNIRTVDTILKQLPPDNRAMARLLDSLGVYTNELNKANGTIAANNKALKTAENRLIWMAAVLLLAGVVIGVLVRFKIIPKLI